MRVLVIEDEGKLAKNICRMIEESLGYTCEICHDGNDGLHHAMDVFYNLIILDLMLPGIGGMEILARLREKGVATPVLILTARDTQEDIVAGLSGGGDDYMTKPFDMREFIERCRALVRRSFGQGSPVLRLGDLEINTLGKKVSFEGRHIELTAMEYKLLEYMVYKVGRVVGKSEVLEMLYGTGWESYSNTIEVFISTMRKKIDADNRERLIKTVRGHGYIIEND